MHLWTVEGANNDTGQEVVESIEAITEEEARADANRLGILISSIRRSLTDAAETSPEETYGARQQLHYQSAAPQARSTRTVPTYENIVKGEEWLGLFATILSAIGWLWGVLLAISGAAIVVVLVQMKNMGRMEFLWALGIGLQGIISSLFGMILFFGTAALLRFIGSVGLAVRDMARNSFS